MHAANISMTLHALMHRLSDKLFSSSSTGESACLRDAISLSYHDSAAEDPKKELDELRVASSKKSSMSVRHNESHTHPSSNSSSFIKLTPQASNNSSVLPAVSIAQKTTALVPTQLGSPSGASNRRKSTPAALDVALRTAEGKAAIEDLLNNNGHPAKKPMAFAQFFGSPAPKQAPSPTSPQGGPGSSPRSNLPAVSQQTAMEPRPPEGPRAPLAQRHAVVTQTSINKVESSAQSTGKLPNKEHQHEMRHDAAAHGRETVCVIVRTSGSRALLVPLL